MKNFLLAALVALLFSGCSKETAPTITGTWKLIKYHDHATGITETEPKNLSNSIALTFTDDGTTGSISGHTVTNSVYGRYELTGGNEINIIQLGGTEVGEPAWGYKFWDAVGSVSTYQRQGKTLRLYHNNNSASMEFIIK